MNAQNNNPKGIVFILISMMVFSVQDGIMKHIYNFVSLYEIYLIRTVVSFVLILLFLIITKKPIVFKSQYPLLTFTSVILFYAGIAFAFFVVFPLVFSFFSNIAPSEISVMPDIKSYLDFVLKLFFAFGISFQIPIAIVILSWMNALDPYKLSSKRPYVVILCFILGMFLTPPDVISQILLAVPTWLLFELGLLLGKLISKKNQSNNAAEMAEE